MVFDHILGQAPAVETLRHVLSRQRVPHAYRFEGPSGVGKEMLALALAQSLLCVQPKSGEGCDECSSCRRALLFNDEPPAVPTHPDVVLIARGLYNDTLLKKSETNGIGVEQVKTLLLARAHVGSHEGRALVFIVRDAEELTVGGLEAANALLKTLEEPPPQVHFILLTSRPNRLLDTLRSRTQVLRLGPLPDTVIEEILRRHDLPTEVAPLAQGSAQAALQLADSEERAIIDAFRTGLDAAIQHPDLSRAVTFAAELPRERARVQALLRTYAQFLALRGRTLGTSDSSEALIPAWRYRSVQRAINALEHNAATSLAIEAMIAEMRSGSIAPHRDERW